jgi:hypothetical protein
LPLSKAQILFLPPLTSFSPKIKIKLKFFLQTQQLPCSLTLSLGAILSV